MSAKPTQAKNFKNLRWDPEAWDSMHPSPPPPGLDNSALPGANRPTGWEFKHGARAAYVGSYV